jgi:hypothetical protein
MFVEAIETAIRFTRPIHFIARNYGSDAVIPGTATLFFINAQGWAFTCRHVAQQLVSAEQVMAQYSNFRTEAAMVPRGSSSAQHRQELERKYGYSRQTTVEIRQAFVNCVIGRLNVDVISHPTIDMALLHFRDFDALACDWFPTFPAVTTGLKQGKFLCRLGFPFPAFTNFAYDKGKDTIEWTGTGRQDTPQFPLEGMLTRYLGDEGGNVIGFEMSTPGLRGQSGGPVFDNQGRVWGMQAATNHLDLDFDVDQEVLRGGQTKRVNDSAFLHVGHCIHVDAMKEFMRLHGVGFWEG